LYGPPILKGIKALEKIAIDMPQVCIMDTFLDESFLDTTGSEGQISGASRGISATVSSYFTPNGKISDERCNTIISKSGETVGEYDFYFEWFKKPTINEYNEFLNKVDEALSNLNIRYSITNK
jgi:hypothetical protein